MIPMTITPASPREQAMLSTLPPPPSALPDFFIDNAQGIHNDMRDDDDRTTKKRTTTTPSKLPASAAKASSAARSMAAAARSKLAKGGMKVLSPLSRSSTSSLSASSKEADAPCPRSSPVASAPDPLATVASAAGSLTVGLTSSLSSASASFSSLLFSSQDSGTADVVASREDRAAEETAAFDAAAAAEVLRKVTAQQRMKILEDLVQHRRADWNYLKAMHEGSNYWLNVALLREQQVMHHLGEKQSNRRGAQFFYLGIGLGRLLGESMHSERFAMDCCQLLEELEFYFSSSTVQGMKMMVAPSSSLHEPVDSKNRSEISMDEPFRPTMHKWNQRPVYRRLLTPPIPFQLDYREVLLSLCDILTLIYNKLIEDSSASENVNSFHSILSFDDRIKKLFIDPVKKEFAAVALHVMTEEMKLVRKLYASGAPEHHTAVCTTATSASGEISDPDMAAS